MLLSRYSVACLAIMLCQPARSANCPSGGTTIFYANGLNTDTGHAIASLLNLRTAILDRLAYTGNSISKACLAFVPALNLEFTELVGVGSDNKIITTANFLTQLVDAGAQQGVQLTPHLLWGWLTGALGGGPPDWFTNKVSFAVTSVASTVQVDLIVQRDRYQQELNAGNKVIVVAHSQGNLYANQAYTLLSTSNQANFSIVAVATPAPSVPGGGPHFTLYNDIIGLVPGHAAENIRNDPPSPCLTGDSVGCHDFDNSYLTGNYTQPRILDAAISAIPFSQPGKVGIAVTGALDGNTWPIASTAAVSYSIGGPQGAIIGQGIPSSTPNLPSGQYVFTYQSGGPPNSTLLGIMPCQIPSATPSVCNFAVSANQNFVFTLNFRSNPPVSQQPVTSEFSSGTQGWFASTPIGGGTFQWVSNGGNPGGAISETVQLPANNGSDAVFYAPGIFSGNLSSYYGGAFSFDMKVNVTGPYTFGVLTLQLNGPGFSYILNPVGIWITPTKFDVSGNWKTYSFPLVETAWQDWAGASGPRVITKAQFISDLSNVGSVQIYAQHDAGASGAVTTVTVLDNVILSPPAHP